jgi:putative ABC transport system substrate-binding protein
MNRRRFLLTSLAAACATPLGVEAQQARTSPKVGHLSPALGPSPVDEVFEQSLQGLGWVRDQNVRIERRFAEGRIDRFPTLVDELLRLKVHVLFAASPQAVRAASQATGTVPIVGIDLETDPVDAGWVKTLARPGGNITGFFLDLPELGGKLIQFLTEAVPRPQRVAVLWDAPLAATQFKATEGAARAVRLELQSLPTARTSLRVSTTGRCRSTTSTSR